MTFRLSDTQMKELFDDEANAREKLISGVPGGSFELLAVLSAQYSGLYGPGLKRAIADGDRAEAWFELRYGWINTTGASDAALVRGTA